MKKDCQLQSFHLMEKSLENFIDNTEGVIPYDLDIDNDDYLFYGGHTGREGAGDPFDYTCVKINVEGNLVWIKHFANLETQHRTYKE